MSSDLNISKIQNQIIVISSRQGWTDVINILVKKYKKVNGSLIIRNAAMFGHCDIVQMLLKHETLKSYDVNLCAQYAATYGYTEILKVLLTDPRLDPSFNNNYLILKAIQFNQDELVEHLVKDIRVNPACKNNYPLLLACMNRNAEAVKTLLRYQGKRSGLVHDFTRAILKERIDPSARNNEAIKIAIKRKSKDIVGILLADHRLKITYSWQVQELLHLALNEKEMVDIINQAFSCKLGRKKRKFKFQELTLKLSIALALANILSFFFKP